MLMPLQLPVDWPEPVEIVNPTGASPVVLLCEHASNHIPREYCGLGLSSTERASHIAWDIGAAEVTRRLSAQLDAPAFLGTYSRVVVDLNRPPGSSESIAPMSAAIDIPGNAAVAQAERRRREQRIFEPFHATVRSFLDRRIEVGTRTVLVAIHSFTPTFLGTWRPWHAGVLFDAAKDLGNRIVERLATDSSINVAANQPYTVNVAEDYAILVHGDDREIPAILIEIRNDGISGEAEIEDWAARLALALRPETR